jgi:hypothetical protein
MLEKSAPQVCNSQEKALVPSGIFELWEVFVKTVFFKVFNRHSPESACNLHLAM